MILKPGVVRPFHADESGPWTPEIDVEFERGVVFPLVGTCYPDPVNSGLEVEEFVVDVIETVAVTGRGLFTFLDADLTRGESDLGGDFFRAAVESGIDVLQEKDALAVVVVFKAFPARAPFAHIFRQKGLAAGPVQEPAHGDTIWGKDAAPRRKKEEADYEDDGKSGARGESGESGRPGLFPFRDASR